MIIKHLNVHEVETVRYEFAVTTYEDDEGELHYMATMADVGMTVGISENPYDAIRELCDNLMELDDEDEEAASAPDAAPPAGDGEGLGANEARI